MLTEAAAIQARSRRPRRTARGLAAALVVMLGIVATGTSANAVLDRLERRSLPEYGTRVHVTGGEVNVYRHGDHGPTIVMLGGYGTAAPAVDFAPLIRQLDDDYRIVVVEGLGYGYSDTSGPPRTIENITSELHEAVSTLHLDGPYVLLGHSVAGIYDLYYANRYRAEVSAVIGIDASLPGQVNGLAGQDGHWRRLVATTGLLRVATAVAPSLSEPDSTAYTPAELQQMRAMANWNWANPAQLDEAHQADRNFAVVAGLNYPRDLPVLSFVKKDGNPPDWARLHAAQLQSLDRGELVELSGGHYLHWTQSVTMSRDIRRFVEAAR